MTLKRTKKLKPPSNPSSALFTGAAAVDWKPHKYQKKSIKFLLEHSAAMLLLDPGLGKTSIVLAALMFLLRRKLIEKVLLVAPLRVCHSVWPRELKKWADFHELRAVVLHGPKKDELIHEPADIYIVNPDGLPWLLGMNKEKTETGKTRVSIDVKSWKDLGFDTLVIDELSKFKDSGTQRFKAIKQVLPTFGRRWGLTGSPASNGLLDLFGQCFIIDEGRSLGRFITHYRSKYFVPAWDGYSWNLKDGADKQIYKRIKPLALRMAAEDYIDMPQLIENDVMVTLPKEARRIYDTLEDALFVEIKKKVVVAANAAVASMKCRQVANGGVYVDPAMVSMMKLSKSKREWIDLHDEKLEAIADLVDELQGEPLLVAYDFEHDLARLKARLGKKTPHIGGGVSTKAALDLEGLWNAGKLPVLLGHPQSLAHGLNLQGAGRHIAWHSLTWNFELYDQFNRRVRRQGQKAKQVFVHHIISENTVDEDVLTALRAKNKGQQALFTALETRRKLRMKVP
jgi:SNF2 family DNA or RNA helicase